MSDITSAVLDLSGTWQLALDRFDEGLRQDWHAAPLGAAQPVTLPGSLMEQQIGDEVTALRTPWIGDIKYDNPFFVSERFAPYRHGSNLKIPYWLTPLKYYAGPAWYQRRIDIPADWTGRRIVLHLERPHWETRLFIDNAFIGRAESLATPHEYDLTPHLRPGQSHTLTLRVDNRMIINVGPNSHSVSDHTQGNWNGIVGKVELRATAPVFIGQLSLNWSAQRRTLRLTGTLGNHTARTGHGRLDLAVNRHPLASPRVAWDTRGGSFDVTVPLPDSLGTWDEFTPTVHQLSVALVDSQDATLDSRSLPFGLRDLARSGRRITLNSRPLFLRGTLECCVFPLTGYPPTTVEPWREIMRVARSHGLNHLRFHSYCPPDAAFIAADEAGVYLQVECSSWPNQGATVGDGAAVDQFLHDEAARIIAAYGHHPSFCFLASGNEPGGERQKQYLSAWITRWQLADPMRLHTTGAGWPVLPESDFHSTHDPRLHQWGDGLRSRLNATPPETASDYTSFVSRHDRPVVSHEIGQWCVFPNLEEIPRYTGVYRARNFELVRDRLAEKGISHLAPGFLASSGKLQALCYKEEIEAALRTSHFGGFQLLGLTDFPGQGTALVGVLDAFWGEKGYITPEAFRRFCGPTVPLARLARRTFTQGQPIVATIDIAHFGPKAIANATLQWSLLDSAGRPVQAGTLAVPSLPTGELTPLGSLNIPTESLAAPARYSLVTRLAGTDIANDWDVWIYPRNLPPEPAAVHFTRSLDDALKRLSTGATVLLNPPVSSIPTTATLGFTPIFWNTCWTDNQAPHTLGLLIDPAHPAFAHFPTGPSTDWQWWDLIHTASAIQLDRISAPVDPICRVIDDWNELRPLALIFEAAVGPGRLLVCSADLDSHLDARPAARQLRHALLHYLSQPPSRPLTPPTPLTPPDLEHLLRTP